MWRQSAQVSLVDGVLVQSSRTTETILQYSSSKYILDISTHSSTSSILFLSTPLSWPPPPHPPVAFARPINNQTIIPSASPPPYPRLLDFLYPFFSTSSLLLPLLYISPSFLAPSLSLSLLLISPVD
jgi:hypothetical protein